MQANGSVRPGKGILPPGGLCSAQEGSSQKHRLPANHRISDPLGQNQIHHKDA